MLPHPLDVLEATLGPEARVVPLDDVRVVRTTGRSDHAAGNAVHHLRPLDDGWDAVLADLDQRFPTGRARVVAPTGGPLPTVPGMRTSVVQVLRRADGPAPAGRSDLDLGPPTDDRAWHGLTVLHRHAAGPGEDRARGADDDRLRWWVDGLRTLVGQGRARVLRATRFGTPVAAGALHWSPGAPVGDDHAGLAVLADVVVHPAHRGLGIGRALTEALVTTHRNDFPRAAVLGVWERPGTAAVHRPPSGWTTHTELAVLTRQGDGPDEARR